MKNIAQEILGTVVKKVAETAIHAAVFQFVSNKVSEYMKKDKDEDKIRVVSKPDAIASE